MSTPTGSAPGAPAIEVTGLTKRFGRLRALDGFDLHVATGSVHGFLGPNGAGKSATIRVLLGMYRRDAGGLHLPNPFTTSRGSTPRLASWLTTRPAPMSPRTTFWPPSTPSPLRRCAPGGR